MKIKAFNSVIKCNHLKKITLNDRTLVVDAQNFFYDLYQESGLQYVFGCESDKFAAYLKNHLSMFRKANVNCYFIFKGGHRDMEKRLVKQEQLEGHNFILGEEYKDIVIPIFMKDVYKQVMDEMDFNYTICEFEAKRECIAFAQKLGCPVMSFDMYFAFSGQPYIPYTSLAVDNRNNLLTGGVFSLDSFLQTYSLTDERLAVFVALTDRASFPEDHFLPFVKALRIPLGIFKRNLGLLHWLGKTSRDLAVKQIFKHIDSEDKEAFLEAEKNAYDTIRRVETPGIPTEYLEYGNKIDFLENDPLWFEKGVALKHIPIPLINITRAGIVVGSWAIADNDAEDAMLFAIDIIKYAYNLLTNFQNKEFTFHSKGESVIISVTDSVKKPDYEAINSPFENGWERLPKGLFEHFLQETMEGFDPDELDILPENSKMLIIALVYFIKRKSEDVTNEVLSLLLSYVTLTVLPDSEENNNMDSKSVNKIRNHFDPGNVTDTHKQIAKDILKTFFVKIDVNAAKKIFNRKWLHPLVEFQHCLEYLNHVNTLCGCRYQPTVFSRSFNATFVYKVLCTVKAEWADDGEGFVNRLLKPAPSVLKFLLALYEFVKNM